MRLNKISLAALVLGGSVLLSACGGGNDSPFRPVVTASRDAKAEIKKALLAESEAAVNTVLGQTFTFPSGVLGTAGSTTLTLSGDKAKPIVTLAIPGQAPVIGFMSYGSCIFTITSSPFTSGPLVVTAPPAIPPITIEPCTLTVGTSGHMADGSSIPSSVRFTLDGIVGTVILPVSVDLNGNVMVNGLPFGITGTVATTGAGS
jgi:hypothetical protein